MAKAMKKIADKEASEGIHFNIIEKSGKRMKAQLQKSNPTATPGCKKDDVWDAEKRKEKEEIVIKVTSIMRLSANYALKREDLYT